MEKCTLIGTLVPHMKNLSIQCIVLEMIGESRVTREGNRLFSFFIADASGSIELLLLNESGRYVKPGDILRLSGAYVAFFHDSLKLYLAKFGRIRRIGEFNMLYSESPNISAIKAVDTASTSTPSTSTTPTSTPFMSTIPGGAHG